MITPTIMVTTTNTRMATRQSPPARRAAQASTPLPAPSLLRLMWLASPVLPVGGFSYSEGLEGAVDASLVTNQATTESWLTDQLHLSLARCDMPLLAKALGAWRRGDHAQVDALNQWLLATRETAELRLQTEQMGHSLAQLMQAQGWGSAADRAALLALQPTPCYPVAFALAACETQASAREVLLAFGFGWCEAMTQAAIRAVPLGQTAAQRVLATLSAELPAAVDAALQRAKGNETDWQAFTPGLAHLSARHEAQYSRLFRS